MTGIISGGLSHPQYGWLLKENGTAYGISAVSATLNMGGC